MSKRMGPTLLERATALLARSGPATALAIVPLAAAAPAQAQYLHKWTYDITTFSGSPNGGSAQNNVLLVSIPNGDKLTGIATYTLSNSAIANIRAGYSGAGAGSVFAGD